MERSWFNGITGDPVSSVYSLIVSQGFVWGSLFCPAFIVLHACIIFFPVIFISDFSFWSDFLSFQRFWGNGLVGMVRIWAGFVWDGIGSDISLAWALPSRLLRESEGDSCGCMFWTRGFGPFVKFA